MHWAAGQRTEGAAERVGSYLGRCCSPEARGTRRGAVQAAPNSARLCCCGGTGGCDRPRSEAASQLASTGCSAIRRAAPPPAPLLPSSAEPRMVRAQLFGSRRRAWRSASCAPPRRASLRRGCSRTAGGEGLRCRGATPPPRVRTPRSWPLAARSAAAAQPPPTPSRRSARRCLELSCRKGPSTTSKALKLATESFFTFAYESEQYRRTTPNGPVCKSGCRSGQRKPQGQS